MRIRSVRIRNFRGFEDETFNFDPASGRASVQRFGECLICKKFAPFFEDEINKAPPSPLPSSTLGLDLIGDPVREGIQCLCKASLLGSSVSSLALQQQLLALFVLLVQRTAHFFDVREILYFTELQHTPTPVSVLRKRVGSFR